MPTNLEEITDKLAEALSSDAAIDQTIFIETYVPVLLEELRVLRNRNSFLELDNAELRNQLEEQEDVS
jgi:hypothetical protein